MRRNKQQKSECPATLLAQAKGRAQLVLSKKNARHIGVFTRYSQLTRVPMDELLEECFSEYIECTLETRLDELAGQMATA